MAAKRTLAAIGLGALLGACGGSQKAAQTRIDDGALARLNEGQMRPVDDVCIEEGRARIRLTGTFEAVKLFKEALDREPPAARPDLYGDGHAAERVVAALSRLNSL